jgi:hypothetical protein
LYESICDRLQVACDELVARLRETRPGLFSRFDPLRNDAFPFWATLSIAMNKEDYLEDRGLVAEFDLFILPDGRWRWSHDIVWAYGPGLVHDNVMVDEPAGSDREAWVSEQVAIAIRFLEAHEDVIGMALDSAGPGEPDTGWVAAPVPRGGGPTLRDTVEALYSAALGPVEVACDGLVSRLRKTMPGLFAQFTHRGAGAYLFTARLLVAQDEAACERGWCWLAGFSLFAPRDEPTRWTVRMGPVGGPVCREVSANEPPGVDPVEWVSERATDVVGFLESYTDEIQEALESGPPD